MFSFSGDFFPTNATWKSYLYDVFFHNKHTCYHVLMGNHLERFSGYVALSSVRYLD